MSAGSINGSTPAGVQAYGYRVALISVLAAAVGSLAAVIAYALYNLIGLFTNISFYHQWSFHFRSPQHTPLGYWVILIPVAGGLLIGLMAKYGSEKIRGHGIPEAMEAVLISRSRIPAKIAILKPLSAAIGIGTGGPFGAEGPIIQTGGAFGSLVGQLIPMTAVERKVMLACGGGAGLAATFNAPITGVLLGLELLLFEFRTRSFIPLVIASTMAVGVRRLLFGGGPMFETGAVDFNFLPALPYYVLLGLICGIAAVGFAEALEKLEGFFDGMKKIPSVFHPAIGALGLGIVGFFIPRVLGSGYDTIEDIINNHIALTVVVLVLVFKAFVVLLSLGSGTSGGTLAPMFMISAALGNVFAVVVNRIVPGAHLSPAAFAIAAMGALLGASARATFTFMFCAFETTRDFHALLPVMMVCIVADAVAYYWMPASIMTQKFVKRGMAVPGEYEPSALKSIRVAEIMGRNVATVTPDTPVGEVAQKIARSEPGFDAMQGVPIVSNGGELVGVVTQRDLLRDLKEDPSGARPVLPEKPREPIVAYEDELAYDALLRMLQNDVGRLPVVTRQNPKGLVGFLNRASFLTAWKRHIEEEFAREGGWLDGWRGSGRGFPRSWWPKRTGKPVEVPPRSHPEIDEEP
ncbi:MAG TPA: chloride channel protein [Candidatus Limnocylindrales bacterium]|nr:chloride channel protein [Candidatus Limnocylindrales bacterium]